MYEVDFKDGRTEKFETLSGQQLYGAIFKDRSLAECDFSCSRLREANFVSANIEGANFSNCYLTGADFTRAVGPEATFSNCRASFVNFDDSHLKRADFSQSRLCYASFGDADLSDVDLTGSVITNITKGNRQEIKVIDWDMWTLVYCPTIQQLAIGCQQHSVADWYHFSDQTIVDLAGSNAIEKWHHYKPILQSLGVFDSVLVS
jgi:hypothetical protein